MAMYVMNIFSIGMIIATGR